jgi:uroporphyrinogen decarboxylase
MANGTPSLPLADLRIASLESRRSEEMTRLIERFGGSAFVSPSMKETPLESPRAAIDFAHRLLVGEIGIVVFLTGVGFRQLLDAVEKHVDRQRFLDTLSDVITVCRGPKPVVAMREVGLTPTYRVPEPNTWRELLQTLDQFVPVANQEVALQEYGKPNPSLVAGLEARGAKVLSIPIYKWDLPDDAEPLKANCRAIAAGERDVLMFTSAHQAVNLLRVAGELGIEDDVRKALASRTVVASIGPTTSEMLTELGIAPDLEPEHPKMGHLVVAVAEKALQLLRRKNRSYVTLSGPASDPSDEAAPWYDSPFMRACRGEPTDVTPIWLMRQAGRYMAEYRETRSQVKDVLELCKRPDLCSEAMCTAVKRLGVDAAIIFSDLLPILEPMGFDLEFAQGEGPQIHNPVREPQDVERVVELESVERLGFVMETVRQTRAGLRAEIPVIGFAGAPFTLASYAVEGGGSRNYLHTKTLMYRDEGAWRELMQRLARSVARYLNAQIAAGAQAVQIFDSWVGCLGVDDYRRYVLPYTRQLVGRIKRGVPVINFATGNPALLALLTEAGGTVIGIDWRVRLDDAWRTVGHDKAVQGNLDPVILLADRETIRRQAEEVLRQAAGRPGHIFNLGHGILPQTPPENVIALVDYVHESTSV